MNRHLNLMLRYVLYISPEFIRKRVHKKHSRREMQQWMEICNRTKVSKEEIEQAVNALDIDGKDVLLHTSMAKIGKMQGGPKWFCECLFKKMDLNSQTLLVSALPYRGRFSDYLKNIKRFDIRTAPIAMGVINERVANMPMAKRSLHPTHSVVAIGKDAEFYTSEHHLDQTPFGEHSPYYRLVKNRGKVVLFGTGLDSFTLVHVCEDLFGENYPIRVYEKKRYEVTCVDEAGVEHVVVTPCHSAFWGIKRDIQPYRKNMEKEGVLTSFPLGESEIMVIDAYHFVIWYLNEMKKGVTMYGRIKPKEEIIQQIEKIVNNL